MGKDGELWDDSALVKALDRAISTYKSTLDVAEEKNFVQAKGDLDCGSRELHSQTETETRSKLEETASNSQVMENSPLGSVSSEKLAGLLNTQNGSIPSASHGNEHMIRGSEAKGPEDYSLLLNRYYELEDQRQKVLQQLNQYGNGNYNHESDYQASVPQAYDTVTCYCPYGCQNWVVPCNSSQAPCSDCACSGKTIPRNGNFPEERDFVKTAMVAAERAMSPVKKEISDNADACLNEGKGEEVTKGTEIETASTDLSVVLNAWYSAGFYTAKYLSEQSAADKK